MKTLALPIWRLEHVINKIKQNYKNTHPLKGIDFTIADAGYYYCRCVLLTLKRYTLFHIYKSIVFQAQSEYSYLVENILVIAIFIAYDISVPAVSITSSWCAFCTEKHKIVLHLQIFNARNYILFTISASGLFLKYF